MLNIINTSLGINREKPRIWLEGENLGAVFRPGQSLGAKYFYDEKRVVITAANDGEYDKVINASGRASKGDRYVLIELRDLELYKLYAAKTSLRAIIKNESIVIEIHGHERAQNERLERIMRKLLNNEPLECGSIFSGAGVLDRAIHDGLALAGIDSYVRVAVELESKYINAMVRNQPELFRENSILINSAIEHVEFRKPFKLDVVCMGIPCVGASKAGKSKNKIAEPEFHPSAGAAFFYALRFVMESQPAIVLLENVCDYAESSSMAVIRYVLQAAGYDIQEAVLNGVEMGNLEDRDRMCLVATTKGFGGFDFSKVAKLVTAPKSLSEVLDDVPLDDKCWNEYKHLFDKQVRDAEAGKGFKLDLYTGAESKVGTIRRQYNKAGSCDQYLIHPMNPDLLRLFTPAEHCRIKGVPTYIINGLATTVAHEVLGQGVCFGKFLSVGFALGNEIIERAENYAHNRLAA